MIDEVEDLLTKLEVAVTKKHIVHENPDYYGEHEFALVENEILTIKNEIMEKFNDKKSY